VPLVEATKKLVDADRLALLKPGSVLLNFSRAGIVDEAAVLAALESGALQSYVCDFPSAALNGHPKVVTLPHLGASTGEAEDNCAVMAAEQLAAYLDEGEIRNSVNFPEASLRRAAGSTRLAIANSNVPNMVGQISTLLADAGLNIADLLNTSRGDLAYTLIDVDGEVSDMVMAKIRAIAGVLSARRL
jgi:D-3-phosphoglycerate dehydrogenase